MGRLKLTDRRTGHVIFEWGAKSHFVVDPDTGDKKEVYIDCPEYTYVNPDYYNKIDKSFFKALGIEKKDDNKS